MKYYLVDLNVRYYLQHFSTVSPHFKEWKALRTLFSDKWHAPLPNNEFSYQMEHIEQLCGDFYRIQLALAKNLPVRGGPRFAWLFRNHKQIAEQALGYEETTKRNPVICELVEILDRKHQSSRKRFKMAAGIHRGQIISHATRSDIIGICKRNDLNSLLPLEHCYLTEKNPQPTFFEHFIEKRLQVIDCRSHKRQTINDKKTVRSEISEEAEGPFIICLNTPGSMAGERERITKPTLLAIVELTEIQHRKCYVIFFSDGIECIETADLGGSFSHLADSLSQSLHGDTGTEPVITRTLRKVSEEGYMEADVITMSDFEVRPIGQLLSRIIEYAKARQTKMYVVSLGGKDAKASYLRLCDKYWEYNIQSAENFSKNRIEESDI